MKNKPNLVEVAKKKRHIFLLERLQMGKTLKPSEIKELQSFEGTKADLSGGVVENQRQVARAFKVSPRTVRYWIEEGMPVSQGAYDLFEIQAWRILKHRGKQDQKPTEKDKWDIEFRKMKALIARMEYKEKKGSLVSLREVEDGQVQRILVVKTAFLALPQRIAPHLVGKDTPEICEILTERIEEIIREFARDSNDESEQNNDGGDDVDDSVENRSETNR